MPFRLATRKSPLAHVQSRMVADRLKDILGAECRLLPMVSTGDRRTEWSLEQRGGKGLFTAELEASLLKDEADLAVHSSKDLPGDMPAGLDAGDRLYLYHSAVGIRDIALTKSDLDCHAATVKNLVQELHLT